jgi:hypothetical protein
LFNVSKLYCCSGDIIEIINSGIHNTDSGPDFFNAQLKIGKTTWAGNIEIHLKSSDWIKHKHQLDKVYDNVILHVVYQNDKPIYDTNGSLIPTLELKGLIDDKLWLRYENLIKSKDWIPCGKQIKKVDNFIILTWLNRLAIERLERKSDEIKETLKNNKNNFEETFYQYLFKYFGLGVNALPFELLAKNTPLKIIEKHNSILLIEALFYGQAGFLEKNIKSEYYQTIKKEYHFLKTKFNLKPIDNSLWKLLRLRPSNFPTIRISQLANLLCNNSRLFSKIIEAKTAKEVQKYFNINASKYWNNHYQFGNESKTSNIKNLGINTINSIIINVIIPFTFVYGKVKSDEKLIDKSLAMLGNITSESNSIINNWKEIGFKSENAMHSQSLIELKKNYCSKKKCLNCSIGNHILRL